MVLTNFLRKFFPERWTIPIPFTSFIPLALSIGIGSWVALDKAQDFITLPLPQCQGNTFDFIIVGGGCAGIIVATRLANATPSSSVLLLEAGGEPSLLNYVPAFDLYLSNEKSISWIYNSTPLTHSCGACDDRKALTTRGKMLGGSSSHNFMFYVRGNKEDYNRWQWEDAGGDPQWSYEQLLPYFKKSEDYHGAYQNDPDVWKYHGKGGLLNVGTYDFQPGVDQFLEAAKEKGYKVGDYNGENQEVFHEVDMTIQDGWRDVARNEVILSAGAIGSAKLMLLSGVGPAEELQEMNIPVIMDLPVGKTMQDHTYAMVGPFLKSPAASVNFNSVPQTVTNFLLHGRGPLAAPASIAGWRFMQSPLAQPSYPDLQLSQFSAGLYPELPQDFNSFLGLNATILNTWFHPYHLENRDARFLLLWLGRPKSVGSMKLASKNPDENPILDPKYLEHPDDIEALLMRSSRFKSDEYYRCVIRQFGGSFYHHVGTCALEKVKGINGLRIIDASIIPRVPNGNTQAGVIMVAEKGVDLILQDFDEKKQFTANLNGKETETFKYLKQTLLHSSQNRV
ncbi:Glucose dehydrogenase [FAD, quinone], partial [Orchesella cincta]